MTFRGMHRSNILILLFWLMLSVRPDDVAAQIRYVNLADPTPDDLGCGDDSNPCQTLEAAIKFGQSGEILQVAPGVYRESPVLFKERMTVLGEDPRRVIIDTQDIVDPAEQVGITVLAPRVAIVNLTIRNGKSRGIELAPGATNAALSGVTVTGADGTCVEVAADGVTIERGFLNGCGGAGIRSSGTITKLTVRRTQIRKTNEEAVDVEGASVTIAKNVIANSGGSCLILDVDDAIVQQNKIRRCAQNAIDVVGRNPRLTKNTITATEEGIAVTCVDDCSKAVVLGNVVADALRDGISVGASLPGLTFNGNRAIRSGGLGIVLSGDEMRITRNTVTGGGVRRFSDGFSIVGANGFIRDNRASENHGAGFVIDGDGHVVEKNRAIGNMGDGFLMSGTTVALTLNQSRNNNGMGIELGPRVRDFVLTRNTAFGNRLDFCDPTRGRSVTTERNKFGSMSSFCTVNQ